MKNKIFYCLAIVSFIAALSSCKKIVAAVFPGTDVNIPAAEFTVPILLSVSPNELSFGSFTQRVNLDSVVRANTGGVFGINVVSSIKLKQVAISLANADALNNLSNLESARVTLISDINTNPVELFNVSFPTENLSTYNFAPTTSVELLPYLKGNSVTYNVFGKNRKITSKPLQMQVAVTLRAN